MRRAESYQARRFKHVEVLDDEVKQSKKNTLSSLSGFPVKDDALRGFATGNRAGKPAERKQEVLTPQSVVDVCNAVWGSIDMDPCYCDGALTVTTAAMVCDGAWCGDGLKTPWRPKAFINPPYNDLKKWLAYGLTQPREQIWLVPVRTHRTWWRAWRDQLDARFELDPLKFVGYDQAFPAPLLLGYMGSNTSAFVDACFNSKLRGGLYRGDNKVSQ